VNLVVLILIPVVFVWVAAEPMADAAKLLGGTGRAVETATTGWAAAFLAALAMFFQVGQARSADRRLVLAGLPAPALVVARMSTGLLIAALASTAALATLFLRTAVDEPLRVAAGTMMFAVIYVGIGAAVGSVVTDQVNGTVVILLVWILDVFFGPALTSPDRVQITRWMPTHFVTLWMVDLPLGHGGKPRRPRHRTGVGRRSPPVERTAPDARDTQRSAPGRLASTGLGGASREELPDGDATVPTQPSPLGPPRNGAGDLHLAVETDHRRAVLRDAGDRRRAGGRHAVLAARHARRNHGADRGGLAGRRGWAVHRPQQP
jgi:hypothetical protein